MKEVVKLSSLYESGGVDAVYDILYYYYNRTEGPHVAMFRVLKEMGMKNDEIDRLFEKLDLCMHCSAGYMENQKTGKPFCPMCDW